MRWVQVYPNRSTHRRAFISLRNIQFDESTGIHSCYLIYQLTCRICSNKYRLSCGIYLRVNNIVNCCLPEGCQDWIYCKSVSGQLRTSWHHQTSKWWKSLTNRLFIRLLLKFEHLLLNCWKQRKVMEIFTQLWNNSHVYLSFNNKE